MKSCVLFVPGVGLVNILSEAAKIPLVTVCRNLAGENRFGGFVVDADCNVAIHTLAVAQYVQTRGGNPQEVLAALCHDLTEGCGLRDIPAPVKRLIPEYKALEATVNDQLEAHYGYSLQRYTMWREADMEMRCAEQILYQDREAECTEDALRIAKVCAFEFLKEDRRDLGQALAETIEHVRKQVASAPRAYDA